LFYKVFIYMKIIITESQYDLLKSFLFEETKVSSTTIIDKLLSGGVPKNKINLLKSGGENSWVLQVVTEKGDILAIQYPSLIDEIPSSDKTKVDYLINNKKINTILHTSAAGVILTKYNDRKLPTSRKN
jgi:hypothetical protein